MGKQAAAAIIGYGPGIGAALASKFMARGHDVALIARNPAVVQQAQSLSGQGTRAIGLSADAGQAAALQDALARAAQDLGPIGTLVYNAAAVRMAQPSALTAADLLADLAVSVAGVLTAVQAVLPGMRAAGQGSVLLTGGGFSLYPQAALASLGVGKAAIRNLAISLAQELGPQGIRVATVTVMGQVAPGTPFDPDVIADQFLTLMDDRANKLGVEVQFKGTLVTA